MTHKLKVTDFDFDTLKVNFKDFLKTRPEFTDYNFEGSNLNVLLDILAYNTHYHALMANFLANEMFIDTAAKRSSVVSHAKSLGYVPRSRAAARATVDLNITFSNTSNPGTSFVFQKGSPVFKTVIDGFSYTFTTANTYSAAIVSLGSNNYELILNGVEIYEGEFTTNYLEYSDVTKFITIPNLDIDLSTLIVEVKREGEIIYDSYALASNILDIGASDKVYFIQEGFNGLFQIYFGDGTFGVAPPDRTTVRLSYMVTHGIEGNGATRWILNNPNQTVFATNYTTEVITGLSTSGSNRESLTSIKFNAVNNYGVQNRAVVADDYAALAKRYSNNVKQIISWGGEENIPPLYNSVVLCVIPESGEDLIDSEKTAIKEFLKKKAVGNTNIIFKSPEYLDIVLYAKFTYDKNIIKLAVNELESLVRDEINAFSSENLFSFTGSLKLSKFLARLDKVDDSITGTNVDITLAKTLSVQPYTDQNHILSFDNKIDSKSSDYTVSSTGFYTNVITSLCYLRDDRKGNMMLITFTSDGNYTIVNNNVGSVDYATGEIVVTFYVTSYVGSNLIISAIPQDQNITTTKNVILRMKNENVTVASQGE
jgi:hypothetical protein